jgi:hypothetical protein
MKAVEGNITEAFQLKLSITSLTKEKQIVIFRIYKFKANKSALRRQEELV